MSELTLPQPAGPTGLYGKLASHGDFVLRRLPQEFVAPWDAWLQQAIAESKLALGDAWEDSYRNAPVWRFLLAPGTCGESAWAGLWQPSVDRVGRHFPLTVAAPLPSNIDVLETMMAAGNWYSDLEHAIAAAFGTEVQFDALDGRLEQLSFPECIIVPANTSEDTLPIAARVFSAFKVSIGQPSSAETVRATLRGQQVAIGPFDCIWSDPGSLGQEAALLVTKGLPSPARFCAMLDGKWETHGWELASPVVSTG